MKKKLSADALDLLTVATITGWPLRGNDLVTIAELVTGGYIVAEEDGISIMISPTTAGVQKLLHAKMVIQDGTKFRLADGVTTARNYVRAETQSFRAPLRVVEPRAPDMFKEGMDAAIKGEQRNIADPDWIAGYDAGLAAKKQGLV